jgi:hypothetical protein
VASFVFFAKIRVARVTKKYGGMVLVGVWLGFADYYKKRAFYCTKPLENGTWPQFSLNRCGIELKFTADEKINHNAPFLPAGACYDSGTCKIQQPAPGR